jgi:hypothetical protein
MKSVSPREWRRKKKLGEITMDLLPKKTAQQLCTKWPKRNSTSQATRKSQDDNADHTGEFLDTVRESELSFLARKNAHHFPSISD